MRVCFILCVALVMLPAVGRAQVYVNRAALDQLAGVAAPAAVLAAPKPLVRRRVVYRAHMKPVARPGAPVRAVSAAVAPKAVAPKVAAPVMPAVPAVARPVYKGPVTLEFAAGRAELPAGAAARLATICAVPGQVTIDAPAADDATDPSAALRLSLARALAVKAALGACGVAPTRVLPRALGDVAGADENAVKVGALGR